MKYRTLLCLLLLFFIGCGSSGPPAAQPNSNAQYQFQTQPAMRCFTIYHGRTCHKEAVSSRNFDDDIRIVCVEKYTEEICQ